MIVLVPILGPTAIEDGFRHKYICEHGVARSGLPVIVAFTFRSGHTPASAISRDTWYVIRHILKYIYIDLSRRLQRRVLLTTEHVWSRQAKALGRDARTCQFERHRVPNPPYTKYI